MSRGIWREEEGVNRVWERRRNSPDTPGFGLALDEVIFQHAVRETGFAFSA
jgi:hypothetical protein